MNKKTFALNSLIGSMLLVVYTCTQVMRASIQEIIELKCVAPV